MLSGERCLLSTSHPRANRSRFNFFLDEVINIKNTLRTEELSRQGFLPRLLEKHELETRRDRPTHPVI